MIKFIFVIFILFFSCSKKSNPCDVMCDNCMGIEQCEECYEKCYNTLEVE